MNRKIQNPFIGFRSYEEQGQRIFFGREKEASELFQLVKINCFTLLYGKSGLGKTSVLQAGLFPKLREINFLPIYIRPNYFDKDSDFVKETEKIIIAAFKKAGLTADNIISGETLW